ncbi:MAG TPA: WD40 repeat domain-containing protein, partial [Gemmataceae bacterium]|nr:WD40 repeat domain-containing protein [Gemmataceae bacterium]
KSEVVAHLGGHTARVTAVAFSRDGKRLAVASGEPAKSGVVKLYAVTVAGPKFELKGELTGAKDIQYALDFAPDNTTLATAGYDRVIRLWNADTLKVVRELKDHSDTVYGVAFSPDGKLLASASADRAVKVWDPETGKRLYTLGDPTDWVYALVWHPDGKRLAAAGVDKSIRVWEANGESGKLVHSVFAHTQPVTRLAYAKDGQFLFSISEGPNLKKWDAAKMVEKFVYPAQKETMLSLALRPDGKQVAVGRYDGTLQLFDGDTGKVTAEPLPVKPKPPTVTRLTPNFGNRFTKFQATLEGQHLDGELTVASNVPGVTIQVWGPSGPTRQAEVSVAADAPVGPVTLTPKTAAGAGPTFTFIVDRYPAVTDAAAIDSARKGRPITLATTIAGTLDRAGRADYFRFPAKAGQQVGAQILTAVVGSKLDPVLELADADGRVLAESLNGLLAYTCPTDGSYAIGVHDKEYRGGADQFYRLHVGEIPIVSGVVPMGVQRGKEATVNLVGVNLGASTATVKVPADAAIGSRVPIPLPDMGEKPLGSASVLVGEFPEVTVEKDQAAIATPGTANGVIRRPGETHVVRFRAKKGERLIIETNARRAGSPLDSAIEVLDSAGKPVGRATLRCTARTFVVFRDHDSAGPEIRIEAWNELAMDDYVYVGNELLRIAQLPLNPDADCNFCAVAGQRVGFLDTTPGHHPIGAPIYKVEIHPPGTMFPPNGLPVFQINYRNDDGGPGYGKDSRLFFDPPADGEYTVRVGDARGQAGPDFGYRLTVRPPRPDYTVSFNPTAPTVWKGGSIPVSVTVNRIDGYAGPVQVKLENLPPGFESPATFIEASQESTTFALYATPTAENPPGTTASLKLVARATIDGKEVVREVTGGAPKVVVPGDLVTTTAVEEVTVRPGGEARLRVKIERRNEFKGRVPIEVRGLPHGVRVLDVGLNGILITERDTEREIAIYAEPWVQPTEHPFVVLAKREGKNSEHGARSVLLKVRK